MLSMVESTRIARAERMRWSTASELLRLVNAEPGITRAAAAERLALSSGAATELIDRLRAARLVSEERAQRRGPGRPTTVLLPHPEGPLVVAVDLSVGGWRVVLGELGGDAIELAAGEYGARPSSGAGEPSEARRAAPAARPADGAHDGASDAANAERAASGEGEPGARTAPGPADADPPAPIRRRRGGAGDDRRAPARPSARGAESGGIPRPPSASFLPEVARAVADAVRRGDGRARTVAASVAGAVSGETLLFFPTEGWGEIDLRSLLAGLPGGADVVFAVGNDAALAGLAEARSGAARGIGVALHVTITVGIGGSLVVDGRPMTGTRGAGGEYGHLPMGDPSLECPCGARGCWGLTVDGRALARHRGDEPPARPYAYGGRLLERVRLGTASEIDLRACAAAAGAFGAGLAGLVNLHDPGAVTVAGLAPALRAAAPEAFDRAYRGGLMTIHRGSPPPVVDAAHGDDGPLRGALALGFDEATRPEALARWHARLGG